VISIQFIVYFRADYNEKTWHIAEIVDSNDMGAQERIERKSLLALQELPSNRTLKKEDKKMIGMLNHIVKCYC